MGAVHTIFFCPKCASAFKIDQFSGIICCPFCDVIIVLNIEESEESEEESEENFDLKRGEFSEVLL